MTNVTYKGFTLLEVMVAVAILALSLTAIFSSEAGAIKTAHRARKMTVATELARCKMAEIEEHVAEEGLPAVDEQGSDACCEHAELEGFGCDWHVERVVLPDQVDTSGTDQEGRLLGMIAGGGSGGGSGNAAEQGGNLSELTANGQSGESLQGALGGVGGSMGQTQDMLGRLAFNIAFPILKPAIEEQVRRATVTVSWHEGTAERSFDVVQFLVAPPPTQQPGGQSGGQGGQEGGS